MNRRRIPCHHHLQLRECHFSQSSRKRVALIPALTPANHDLRLGQAPNRPPSNPVSQTRFGHLRLAVQVKKTLINSQVDRQQATENLLANMSSNQHSSNTADPPPLYSPAPPPVSYRSIVNSPSPVTASTPDDPYAFLSSFDTVFLIDDSGSMAGRSWRETADALKSITPICTAHDADGVDIYFLNQGDSTEYHNIKQAADVDRVFNSVRPYGHTPTGARLHAILKPYLAELELALKRKQELKALNIIVITDGVPSDDPEAVIIHAAKTLDRLEAPAWQVGVQFFQVGNEPGAAEALKELDDGLSQLGGGMRDMVDTVPWNGQSGAGLDGAGIMKVVLGAVTRRLDRRTL